MDMLYGYAGRILRIDLSRGTIVNQELDRGLAEKYLGGRGFVASILFNELLSGCDPLGEDNMVVIATGPLTGHFLPGSGKTHFGCKSPVNHGYADSNMGGHFGPALKSAGFDTVVLTGICPRPSVIVIDNHDVSLVPADEYWGKGTLTAEKMLKADLGEDFEIITIGPAGENLVKFACISHDFGRQGGRAGVGTVLGSKKVKAIAVRGSRPVPVYDPRGAYEKGKQMYRAIFAKPGFVSWTPYGTAGITDWVNEVGAFPTRNFQTSYAEHHAAINGQAVRDRLLITDKGCFCCPIPCGKYGHTRTHLGDAYVEGPEYETIALFGGNCELKTIEDVAYANHLCDELGLDTISAGGVIGFVLECLEKGIVSSQQVGERALRFGDLESVSYLLHEIAYRRGIGDVLAEGVRFAAGRFGQGSDRFAIQVKGLEWSGYECRNAPGMMLAYMTCDVGAHHNRAWALGHDVSEDGGSVHDLLSRQQESLGVSGIEGKAAKVIALQHARPLFDALGICRLQWVEIGFEVQHYEDIFRRITGHRCTWEELLRISERIWNLTRCFNVREIDGFGRSWDYPPARFSEEPIPSGPNKGRLISKAVLDRLLDEYYQLRGWDSNGIPRPQTLKDLGLEEVLLGEP